jgi:hypothetical protein
MMKNFKRSEHKNGQNNALMTTQYLIHSKKNLNLTKRRNARTILSEDNCKCVILWQIWLRIHCRKQLKVMTKDKESLALVKNC